MLINLSDVCESKLASVKQFVNGWLAVSSLEFTSCLMGKAPYITREVLTMELFELYKQETGAVEVEMFSFQEWLLEREMSQLSL